MANRLRLVAAAVVISVANAIGSAVDSGYGLSPNCSCAEFCNKSCAQTNSGVPETVTMYRLTPHNVSGVIEKDTGDAAGDLGFYLMTLRKLATCSPSQANTDECFLALEPVIRQFIVETDGRYGPFMRCNPLQFPGNADMEHVDTRHWGCFPWHGYPPTPWKISNHATSCPDLSYCGALMNQSVGRDPAFHHPFSPSHPALGTYFGGNWYSLTAQGECPPDTAPGTANANCSWRLQPGKVGKTVNASCMTARVMAPIEANGRPCFDQCPQPLDRRSSCYFDCIDEAVMGSPAGAARPIKPLDKEVGVAAWNQAFASDTPADGGCPNMDG